MTASTVATTTDIENSWLGILNYAAKVGAKFPEVVAAQWAVESGWGKHESGKNNLFGLKGKNGTVKLTNEQQKTGLEPELATFLDFPSRKAAVDYLVEWWYKDFDGHKGVNRAKTPLDAIDLLKAEGYATDDNYAIKVKNALADGLEAYVDEAIKAMPKPVVKSKPEPILYTLVAVQDTWLKKKPEQSSELAEDERVFVPRGRSYGVTKLTELPRDAHSSVKLAAGAGEWYVWGPHFSTRQQSIIVPSFASIDWSNFDCKVTVNLTVGEILQFDKRRIPNSKDIPTLIRTALQWQAIRTHYGYPLGVTSFHRPEPINTQVGGVRGSYHVRGMAFDIYPIGLPLQHLYNYSVQRWTGGFGDGRHRGFLHFDTRNNGVFVPGGGVRPITKWRY